jgi:pilus assembly protein FimV
MVDNSMLLGGGLVLALLAGLGFARYRKNGASDRVDSSFMDSRLQPDSFFGASGGQRVDTNASSTSRSSSMAYSPSQLDAAGDVDPVAEADVYLAYGRDQQAEEILKEALRTHPARLAVHSKLLEIYAKRHDHKAFENIALTAFKLTGGQGPEWSHISQLGRELQPNNSMYQSGSGFADSQPHKRNSGLVPLSSSTLPSALATVAMTLPVSSLDLDLDAEFVPVASSPAPLADIAVPSAFLDLDMNLDDLPDDAPQAKATREDRPMLTPSSGFDLIDNGLDFTPEPFVQSKAPAAPSAPITHSGMLEFDLGSLSLDLEPAAQPAAPQAYTGQEKDPLEIKFLLAEEFRILGDSDGARSLADEVVAHARGSLKSRAQAFLNTLS